MSDTTVECDSLLVREWDTETDMEINVLPVTVAEFNPTMIREALTGTDAPLHRDRHYGIWLNGRWFKMFTINGPWSRGKFDKHVQRMVVSAVGKRADRIHTKFYNDWISKGFDYADAKLQVPEFMRPVGTDGWSNETLVDPPIKNDFMEELRKL